MFLRPHLISSAVCLALGLVAGMGCASRPTDDADAAAPSHPPVAPTAAPEAPPEPTAEIVALGPDLHRFDMTEVVLDSSGDAALTLDAEGGVRLWTGLRSPDVEAPLVLPVHEPAWMSLARTRGGGFTVAFVDTAGGAFVGRVEQSDRGPHLEVLFELPATDPQFELHVLDGGHRLLSLGHDHRVRLYDDRGTLVSQVDQAGFLPWQLRVSPREGQPAAIVAVLAGPTRVQPIELKEDRLTVVGEARRVVIDRGPNRNDLSLSPDGSTVVALRKPRSRDTRFTIELVDLATDARRLLVGETDDRKLARLHWVDDSRLLLESGSGHGFWVDLTAAIPWTGETGREETEKVEAVPLREVALPASAGSLRSHATIVAGLRVVPTPEGLVVDPVDEDHHVVLAPEHVRPRAVAVDADGDRMAWNRGGRVWIDQEGGADGPRELPSPDFRVLDLAFVDDERLLVLEVDGRVSLVGCRDGQVTADHVLSRDPAIAGAQFGRDGALGSVALLDHLGSPSLRVLDVTPTGFAEVRELPHLERVRWPELGFERKEAQAIFGQIGFTRVWPHDVAALVVDPRGHHLVANDASNPTFHDVGEGTVETIPLRHGEVRRLIPDPTGARVAIVQRIRLSPVFVDFARVDDFDEYAITVYDLSAQRRQWSRPATGFVDLDWSADGRRLAIASHHGGELVEADTGELRLARRHLGLRATELPDPTVTAR